MSNAPTDLPAALRQRTRAYLLRVVLWLFALPVLLFGISVVLRLLPISEDAAGGTVGILALVLGVGGAYAIHHRIVRCPSCERWLVPVGANGFSPRVCPHCKAALR